MKKYTNKDGTDGYLFYYYANREEKLAFTETCTFTNFKGLEMQSPFAGSEYEITVAPGDDVVVILKIVGGSYGYATSSSMGFKSA